MLMSRGLEISESQVAKVWDTVLLLAPCVASGNLFTRETLEPIQTLARCRKVQHRQGPPLGFYPTVSALKLCFSNDGEALGEDDAQGLVPQKSLRQIPSLGRGGPPFPLGEIGIEDTPKADREDTVTKGIGVISSRVLCSAPEEAFGPALPSLPRQDVQPKRVGSWSPPDALPHYHDPPHAFPVNSNPGGDGPAAWYCWEAGDLKE